jgi:hypothetical protein
VTGKEDDFDGHIRNVGHLRRVLADLPDDFPVNWYVDTGDYYSRECQGIQQPVTASIIERTDEEMEGAPDWVKQKMFTFFIG